MDSVPAEQRPQEDPFKDEDKIRSLEDALLGEDTPAMSHFQA